MKQIKRIKWGWYLLLLFIVTSCAAPKNVIYFQDLDKELQQNIEQNYEIEIRKDDLLGITVSARNPELAIPFNLPATAYTLEAKSSSANSQLGYQVDAEGYINFPQLGRISVEGKTRKELAEYITKELEQKNYLQDPVVTVTFQNFKVSVLGEVKTPKVINVKSDRITVLEALAEAGDLGIQAKRDRVAVIREAEGKRTVHYLDLRSSDLLQSPYYYLQQNDVVYVEPNNARTIQNRSTQVTSVGTWVSVFSSIMSVTTLIVTLLK